MQVEPTSKIPTAGKNVVDALQENGVELVFGIPGTHNLEIYRYLTRSGIRHITPRHEQGAGYAADAYARVSGRPGVVITTSGPGLTNASTAVATSYADSVPILLISPGVPRGLERCDVGWLHELKDQHAHIAAIVDRSCRAESAAEAGDFITDVFTQWRSTRTRPAHLEIPVDVLEGRYEQQNERTRPLAVPAPSPDPMELAQAARALSTQDAVVIVAGGGASQASLEVQHMAERLNAVVITTVNGKGIIPESHPLSLGACIRFREAHDVIRNADAVLVVGATLGDAELWGNAVEAHSTVIRIDIQEAQLHKNLQATIPLHGDARQVLAALLELLHRETLGGLGEEASELRRNIQRAALSDGADFLAFHDALRKHVPPETIICGDSAQVSYFGTAHQWMSLRPRQFLYPVGYATLGYGIPAAIGASLAAPQSPVMVIAGDGGTMFSIQEFATAVDLSLGIPVIVMNNGGFAQIREEMEGLGIQPLGVDVRSPDFTLLAQALGGEGLKVTEPEELAVAASEALAREIPTLIEVDMAGRKQVAAAWKRVGRPAPDI